MTTPHRDASWSGGPARRSWAVARGAAAFVVVALACMPGVAAALPGGIETAASVVQADGEEPAFARSPIYLWLRENRAAAYWLAPLLMIVVAILPIPAEIPAAMNGMLFGTLLGIAMSWGGALVGAQISYELARFFGRRLASRFVKPEAMAKLETLKDTQAPVLLTLRLTPIVAFTVVNWAAGLLQVRRATFFWTTAVGILPGAIAFTASGSAIGWLYEMHPAALTLAVVLVGSAFVVGAWWKRRRQAAGGATV